MTALTHRYLLILPALILAFGCRQAAPMPTVATLPAEYWEAHFIGDDRVGYSHVTTKQLADGELQISNLTEIALTRFGQKTSQTIEVNFVEAADGAPVRFQCVVKSGETVNTQSTGKWEGDRLQVTATTQGQEAKLEIAWKPEYGGPFADALALLRQPLKPGEKRSLMAFLPSLNQLAEIELAAGEFETAKLLDDEANLLRVEAVVKARTPAGMQKLASTYWVDQQGEVLKSYLPQLKQTTYRTTKEKATAPSKGSFDLAAATTVKLSRPLTNPHASKSITYKATLPEGEIEGVFVEGPTQQVKLVDQHTCELAVRAIRPGDPDKLETPDTKPTPDDLAPNTLIQSDDPRVVKMAGSVLPEEKDAWTLAKALEAHVHRAIERKNFSQAFLTAAQVAEELQGDCTEHAVLLAALCRARQIPARCAMGLVYYPQGQGFAYHMWTEAWIDDRWVPLDATLGRGGIGAAHLKLAHSNLKGADAYSAFLPVVRVLGQLQLEVLDQTPASGAK
jgi:hypothetical protein